MVTTPPMKEQRRSPRFRHDLVVELQDKRGKKRLVAMDVARHGLSLATDDPPRERHLVQLIVHLPDGPIRAAASVTRHIPRLADQDAGVGLQFFALSDDAKHRWDDFMLAVQRTTPPRGTRLPSSVTHPPGGAAATTPPSIAKDPNGAVFLVKLKSRERLADFARTHLVSGGTVLFTPVLRAPGEHVTLTVIHPATDEEFRIPGVVARAHSDKPKRLEIHFPPLTAAFATAFHAFVETGRAPLGGTVTLPPAPAPVLTQADRDFDVDVDVFDEDSLEVDDRVVARWEKAAAEHRAKRAGETPTAPRAATTSPPLAPDAHPQEARTAETRAAATRPEGRAPFADPGLAPTAFTIACDRASVHADGASEGASDGGAHAGCTAPAYRVEIGPCRGALGLVADLVPFLSPTTSRVVTAPRLVASEERAQRHQQLLARGGRLDAVVDLYTLLQAVSLASPATDPESGDPLRTNRNVDRLLAAARHLADAPAGELARTKVRCASCEGGVLTVRRAEPTEPLPR